jgi:cold-inducible RNA-binding protein
LSVFDQDQVFAACSQSVSRKGKIMKKLFVGNIPHSTTEAELRTLFEPHGKIDQVSIVTDRDTGRSRGFAFVEMSDASEAEKAIAALNGKELGGRALNINEARPKTERGGGFGGGRPGGGGGRPGGGGRSGGGGGRSSGGGGGRDDYQGHARQPREPRW